MGLFDSVLGRRKPPQPDLDALFRLPAAVLTLQAALDLVPTGVGSVAFRAPTGRAFADVQAEVTALVQAGPTGAAVAVSQDDFGFTWLALTRPDDDVPGLVTDLHAVNSTLKDSGFGPTLLCSLIGLRGPAGDSLALVYLFKQGTFYPFAPHPDGQSRDNLLELQIRDVVGVELPIEPDLQRWFAVWGAPGT